MGSFNSSCSLSNLQIKCQDEIVAFYLEKKNPYKSYGIYPWDNYKIASGGLTGIYNDYGKIELHKNDSNSFLLKLLESDYTSFSDFQDGLWSNSGNAMMFILKDVYDAAMQMNPLASDEVPFLIQAFDEHRKTEESVDNPGFAMQEFWDFCMEKNHKKVLAGFFIGSASSPNAPSLGRKITKHFAQVYQVDKFSSEKSVSELEYFNFYTQLIAENHAIISTFFIANKLIMPQFTTSQDTKFIEEALWQQKIMNISADRVSSIQDNSYFKTQVDIFKESQKIMLEKHILDFGLDNSSPKKNKAKM